MFIISLYQNAKGKQEIGSVYNTRDHLYREGRYWATFGWRRVAILKVKMK